ncbi:hypothetical protein AVEN_17229-1 [Araneus ventricosus]|uniref:Uncharacterized protein n=1 Tax=Araneus ventricosus TaxID=182803 RepID=A0A4Y2FLU0_ARAVE|nr:hypothetical protein AVEN_17229-1 [Araneus ventricosus]
MIQCWGAFCLNEEKIHSRFTFGSYGWLFNARIPDDVLPGIFPALWCGVFDPPTFFEQRNLWKSFARKILMSWGSTRGERFAVPRGRWLSGPELRSKPVCVYLEGRKFIKLYVI